MNELKKPIFTIGIIRLILVGTILSLLCSGCKVWTKVTEAPPFSQNIDSVSIGNKSSATLVDIDFMTDDVEIPITEDFLARSLDSLRSTKLFTEVKAGGKDNSEMLLSMSVKLRNRFYPGDTLAKTLLMGFSMGILIPVLPLKAGCESDMTLDVIRPDGAQRQYNAYCKGNQYFHLFAGLGMVEPGDPSADNSIARETTTRCFNSLMNQMIKDVEFFKKAR